MRLMIEEVLKRGVVFVSYFFARGFTPISPIIAAKFATLVWFTPVRTGSLLEYLRKGQDSDEISPIASNESRRLNFSGERKVVLLIHGWGGSSQQFKKISEKITRQGLQILDFDFKAHGFSPGLSTDIVEMTRQLESITKDLPAKFYVVTHSFGLLVASRLARSGKLNPEKLVAISAPANFDYLLRQFFKKTRFSQSLKSPLVHSIQLRVGNYIKSIDEVEVRKTDFQTEKILLIHDLADKEVTTDQLEIVTSVFSGPERFITTGYGHNRILRQEVVLNKISDFLVN